MTYLMSFAATLILHLLALKIFPALGLLDFPEKYNLKRGRLPYPTGIIAPLVFVGFFAFASQKSIEDIVLLGCIALLAVVCFFDDRKGLPSILRLAVQGGIGLALFAAGVRIFSITNPLESLTGFAVIPLDTLVIPFAPLSDPSVIGAVFTAFWISLTINALNWFDGIPGQVSILSVIGFLTIGFLAISSRVDQPHLAHISFLLASIALGSALFDFPPNKVVMGDSGAMFFGLMLGVLTIYAGGKLATAFLVLGVPLTDLAIVIARRIAKGKSIFRGDSTDEHLHHRLLLKGWSQRSVIVLTASIGSLFGISALFMNTIEKFIAVLALFGVMLILSIYSKLK